MELYSLTCREPEVSVRSEMVKRYVQEGHSIDEVGEFLSTKFVDDFFEVSLCISVLLRARWLTNSPICLMTG